MSTTTAQLTTPPAPWSSLFQSHLSKLPSPEFVLASLHPTSTATKPTPKQIPTPFLPRLRYCIYRGMWASLPENHHNPAPRNPQLYDSDLPTFTTDARMQKVPQIFSTGPGHAVDEEQSQGSGGGGPVEAVWWVKDVGTQWRVRGEAWVVGLDVDVEGARERSGVRSLRSEVGRRMRRVGEEEEKGEGEWSWGRELRAHFGNVSPGMRGTFRNPPPGTPTNNQTPPPSHSLGQKVTDLDDPIARENFRVVVIVPEEVEQLDLSDPAKARRWLYRFVVEKGDGDKEGVEGEGQGKGVWTVEELWP